MELNVAKYFFDMLNLFSKANTKRQNEALISRYSGLKQSNDTFKARWWGVR